MAEGEAPAERPRGKGRRRPDNPGPYVTAAILCENLLRENNVFSPIRIIDQVTVRSAGEGIIEDQRPIPVDVKALIIFRAGEGTGHHRAQLRLRDPEGKVFGESTASEFELPYSYSGYQIPVNLRFPVTQPGRHWIDVLLNGSLVTRMLLDVRLDAATGGEQPETTSSS